MENQPVSWENQLLMAIFNSYVKLPEGMLVLVQFWHWRSQTSCAGPVEAPVENLSVRLRKLGFHNTAGWSV